MRQSRTARVNEICVEPDDWNLSGSNHGVEFDRACILPNHKVRQMFFFSLDADDYVFKGVAFGYIAKD